MQITQGQARMSGAGPSLRGISSALVSLLSPTANISAVHPAQDLRPKDFKRRLRTRGGELAKGIKGDLKQLETLQKELKCD